MELQLAKRYPVAASRAQAWAVLGDLQAVAACMPGAQITEQLDATHYKGEVRAKVGPANMSFQGEIEVLQLDTELQQLSLLGKGADKGGSAASLQLIAELEDAAEGCLLVGKATVKVSGKLAQIGSRLLAPASDALLAQFAANFAKAAAAVTPKEQAVAATAAPIEPTSPQALNALALLRATLRAWLSRLLSRGQDKP